MDSVETSFFGQISAFLDTAGMWFVVSLLSAFVLVHIIKFPIKQFWPKTWGRILRRYANTLIAVAIGYYCGDYFLVGPDAEKMARLVALLTPTLYFGLVQYAAIRQNTLLMAILKLRRIDQDGDGKLSPHETQQFWGKDFQDPKV